MVIARNIGACTIERMIPTRAQAVSLWRKYHLPPYKRHHCTVVAALACTLARALMEHGIPVNERLVEAAALLHDIDKAIQRLPGEHHPDTGVRILREEGFAEIADVVRTHPLHAILDQNISPKTWEERLLFLSDKMVKHNVVGVDARFALWRGEHLPPEAVRILDEAYPEVKKMEREVASLLGVASLSELGTIQKGV